MAEEISESMAQRFAGIFYLLEVEEAAVAGGTPGYLAQAKEAARKGIREAMRVRTCDPRTVLSVTSPKGLAVRSRGEVDAS